MTSTQRRVLPDSSNPRGGELSQTRHSLINRVVAVGLTVLQAAPTFALSAQEKDRPQPAPTAATKVVPNRTAPVVVPPPLMPRFSEPPTDADFFRARVFDEPLVPLPGPRVAAEDSALANAILGRARAGASEDIAAFEEFLTKYPNSRWKAALLVDLGIVYRRTGYFSRALDAWDAAWAAGKGESSPQARAITDRAVGELAELNARLGRFERLQTLFAEAEGRDVRGSAAEKLSGARAGYSLMQEKPEAAFRCGPMALDRILAYGNAAYRRDKRIIESRSTPKGTSLDQMRELAGQLGMPMQAAKRTTTTAVIVPALVHWKAGHFAALVAERDGRYLIQDPTFGDELWVTRNALDDEGSGYFLVREGALPSGWEGISREEAATIWGKGNTGTATPEETTPESEKAKECKCKDGKCGGMADYNFHSLLVSLNLMDTPVGYTPPRGPSVDFTVTYNQREAFQPQIFSYSNLGHQWTFDWLSYIEDNPGNPNESVTAYRRGGGRETYSGFNPGTNSYAPHMRSRAIVVRTSSSPISYERRLPNGSVEVFAQPDGASAFPRRIFMTQARDAQGNGLTFTYDASLRLVSVRDAIDQVTTLSYTNADPLKITRVTDPFGRFAELGYSGTGQLIRITDVIGMESSFAYGQGDFVNALTTPYGTTRFTFGQAGTQRWLEAEDPLGARERLEFRHQAPGIAGSEPGAVVPAGLTLANAWLEYRNVFYWDKRAMAVQPRDYTKARITHFLHTTDVNVASGIVESRKEPLENRVWYTYPNQTQGAQFVGSAAQPTAVARVLDDGTTQAYRYEYNARGKKIKEIDPVGRETVYVYGTNNVPDPDPATGTGIDLLQVKVKNAASPGGWDVTASITYNAKNQPLTTTDAAGQTTTYTYTASGQIETVTTPPRAGITEERTTTYTYAPVTGNLAGVTGPGGVSTNYTYDGYGRVRTTTDTDGYTLTYDYDALDRPTRTTYPDGTYDETQYDRLDAARGRDRLGRWSHTFHDALRRVTSTRDAQGRTTTQSWCTCGSLDKLVDANGNATIWEHDLEGRATKETRANGTFETTVYETTTSRVKKVVDAKLQEIQYTYELDDKPLQTTYVNAEHPTPNVSLSYTDMATSAPDAHGRLRQMTDGTGTTNYGYHAITGTPSSGAGQLASVDGPLVDDPISYSYDELGRIVSRSLNGVTTTWAYDAVGRLTTLTEPIGSFTYGYVGSTRRFSAVTYPNGQTTSYTYLPVNQDLRLQEIHHKRPGGATLNKFNYTYDALGNILTWAQQTDANSVQTYSFEYDRADQVTAATLVFRNGNQVNGHGAMPS
jgi:YD repeat-containing protein